ncbi:mei2 [Symbiodinium natans]|uniref:Mei2 protein n=1 Tax=Symbiodinium natans TaxID=878477 RepID=A0A812QFN0_9DINO|nr:mei2 [Symbiodinium natans]
MYGAAQNLFVRDAVLPPDDVEFMGASTMSEKVHCPAYILRYDSPDVIDNSIIDCHRQARYLSFQEQFGELQLHEQLREDRYIYKAVEQACGQLLSMLDAPPQLGESEVEATGTEGITAVLVKEIKQERVLLLRCVQAFQQRQQESELRPLPTTLAEPLARLRAGARSVDQPEAC